MLGPSGEQLSELDLDSNGSMTWQHTNVYAAGTLMATYDTNGLHFYLNDWLGTRRAQTDFAGVLEQTCSSMPFGDQLACTGSTQYPTEHHFTGKERDQESGNDYFGARYYGSTMGRFMSPDDGADETLSVPVPYADLENPQSLNLYSYVTNNPLRFTDPDGHAHWGDCNDGSGAQCLFGDKLGERNWQNGQWVYWNGSAWDNHPPINDPGLIDLSGSQLLMVAPIGKLVGPLVGSAASKVGEVLSGTLGKAAAESAAQGGAKMLLSGSKQAIKAGIKDLGLTPAQEANVLRAAARAGNNASITVESAGDGAVKVTTSVPGRAGGLATYSKVIGPDGVTQPGSVVQEAFDRSGASVHYDPKY